MKTTYIVGIGVSSFLAGGLIGLIVGKKRAEVVYKKHVNDEITKSLAYFSSKEYFDKWCKEVEETNNAEIIAEARYDETDDDDISEPVTSAEETKSETPMYIIDEDGFDYGEEIPNRSADAPYIISSDEFMEGECDYIQNTLTYYEADDVLADEHDEAIENVDKLVGNLNLTKFGHGSKDPNLVYIRNEAIEVDFEIVKNKRSFASEVHGFIQHDDHRSPRKFRHDDS